MQSIILKFERKKKFKKIHDINKVGQSDTIEMTWNLYK